MLHQAGEHRGARRFMGLHVQERLAACSKRWQVHSLQEMSAMRVVL